MSKDASRKGGGDGDEGARFLVLALYIAIKSTNATEDGIKWQASLIQGQAPPAIRRFVLDISEASGIRVFGALIKS